MELHELEIGDARTGVVGERDAVAGRHGRIRGLAKHLSGATGGEQRRAAPRRSRSAPAPSKKRTPATDAVLDEHDR